MAKIYKSIHSFGTSRVIIGKSGSVFCATFADSGSALSKKITKPSALINKVSKIEAIEFVVPLCCSCGSSSVSKTIYPSFEIRANNRQEPYFIQTLTPDGKANRDVFSGEKYYAYGNPITTSAEYDTNDEYWYSKFYQKNGNNEDETIKIYGSENNTNSIYMYDADSSALGNPKRMIIVTGGLLGTLGSLKDNRAMLFYVPKKAEKAELAYAYNNDGIDLYCWAAWCNGTGAPYVRPESNYKDYFYAVVYYSSESFDFEITKSSGIKFEDDKIKLGNLSVNFSDKDIWPEMSSGATSRQIDIICYFTDTKNNTIFLKYDAELDGFITAIDEDDAKNNPYKIELNEDDVLSNITLPKISDEKFYTISGDEINGYKIKIAKTGNIFINASVNDYNLDTKLTEYETINDYPIGQIDSTELITVNIPRNGKGISFGGYYNDSFGDSTIQFNWPVILNDGKVFGGEVSKINANNFTTIYSDTPIKCGEWVDKRSIYRVVTRPNISITAQDLDIEYYDKEKNENVKINPEIILNISGYIKMSNDDLLPINFFQSSAIYNYIRFKYDSATNSLKYSCIARDGSTTVKESVIIIDYVEAE